jgi:hypothetical protein
LKEASENGSALAPVSKSSLSLPSLPEACSDPEALLLLRLEFSELRPGWGLVEALASASLVSLASQLKCLKQQNNAEYIFILYFYCTDQDRQG